MTIPDAQGQGVPSDPSGLAAEPTDTGTQQIPTQEQQANNPAYWNELQSLPESVRPLVEPIFKDWDSNVGKRLQSVHSEYEPYKQLIDEWEPDALAQSVALAQRLEADPQGFIQAVIEAYGIDLGQGAAGQSQPDANALQQQQPQFDDLGQLDPRLAAFQAQQAQQQQLIEAMAQAMLGEQQQRADLEAQNQLDVVLNDLKTQHGEFDENYVLSLIANNVDPVQAVQMFQQSVSQYASKLNAPVQNAPVVLGQGGGYPSNQVDPATLDDKATNDLVVQMLRAANQQG